MHQHLQQSLVTHSFSLGDFSSLSDICLWKPDGNLRTLPLPAQLGDQRRASRPDAFRMQGSRLPLHIASPRRAGPPFRLVTFGLELRYLHRFPRHSLSFESPNIVAPPRRIQNRRQLPLGSTITLFRNDYRQQPTGVRLAVIQEVVLTRPLVDRSESVRSSAPPRPPRA